MKLIAAFVLTLFTLSQIACVATTSDASNADSSPAKSKTTSKIDTTLANWLENGQTPDQLPVRLDIQTKGLEAESEQAVKDTGAVVLGFYPKYERISATADGPRVIEQILQLPFVRHIALEHGAHHKGTTTPSRKTH
ncbi:MAG: hypothetical protein ACQES2_11720 [Pseudomonadota bacterium]